MFTRCQVGEEQETEMTCYYCLSSGRVQPSTYHLPKHAEAFTAWRQAQKYPARPLLEDELPASRTSHYRGTAWARLVSCFGSNPTVTRHTLMQQVGILLKEKPKPAHPSNSPCQPVSSIFGLRQTLTGARPGLPLT